MSRTPLCFLLHWSPISFYSPKKEQLLGTVTGTIWNCQKKFNQLGSDPRATIHCDCCGREKTWHHHSSFHLGVHHALKDHKMVRLQKT